MTSVIDLWRAVDAEARLVSGSVGAVTQPVRGILRTRAMAPQLPPRVDGELLVVDAALVAGRPLDEFLATLNAAGLAPVALILACDPAAPRPDPAGDDMPVLASTRATSYLSEALSAYLADEQGHLARFSAELRLAAAEAALTDPDPATVAGLVAARIRRGAALVVDGEMRSLHPRPAGRALAAQFAATQIRLLSGTSTRGASTRRTRDGLWLMERRVRPGAAVWLFDDLPFARVDEVALEALGITLRALLRRAALGPGASGSDRPPVSPTVATAASSERFAETLLAVARANGRIAPAARALGVHRNTVLYRLRAVRAERGIDPRRPDDALRILAEAERAAR
jgi:hypothetical protein